MSSEFWIVFVAGLLELFGVLAGLAWAIRKFKDERIVIHAEARSDDANAINSISTAHATLLETYNKTFKQLQDRDAELYEIKRKQSERDIQITELKHRLSTLEESVRLSSIDLDNERNLRKEAEAERKETEKERDVLKAKVEVLEKKVIELEAEIRRLDPAYQFLTSSGI